MATSSITDLLKSDSNPSRTMYERAIRDTIKNPAVIQAAVDDEDLDQILEQLAAKSDRFIQFLHLLQKRRDKTDRICHNIVQLVLKIGPTLSDLLRKTDFDDVLIAAIPFSVQWQDRSAVIEMLASFDIVLETITASPQGHPILTEWVEDMSPSAINPTIISDWTARLVHLAENCVGHQAHPQLAQWKEIKHLKTVLRTAISDNQSQASLSLEELPDLSALKILSKADKHSNCAFDVHAAKKTTPIIDPSACEILSTYDLPIPCSQRMASSCLEIVEREKTLAVLKDLLRSFPCKHCHNAVLSAAPMPERDLADCQLNRFDGEPLASTHPLAAHQHEVEGWKVVISSRAYQELQGLGRASKSNDFEAHLERLITRSSKPELLKPKEAPRIPLLVTRWSRDVFSLWQIDIGVGREPGTEQQVIKIWTIGSPQSIKYLMQDIVKAQTTLPDEMVTRCLDVSDLTHKRYPPKTYETPRRNTFRKRPADFDVRLVDQDLLDTFNKSYTLTDAMVRSIINGDLAAEFPFDLSHEEMEILYHNETATLILGRSGTGKTTCLIFKMVMRYLLHTRTGGNARFQQFMLTRSDHLASKIRDYVKRLLSTLSQKATISGQYDADIIHKHSDILDLFHPGTPKVCTFESFLRLLDDAIRHLDRKDFEYCKDSKNDQRDLLDFRTFRSDYWARFPTNLTKGFSPTLVFSEIMGVIKGSIRTCDTLVLLTREEYLSTSTRIAPNIQSRDDRIRVYQLFELYEIHKAKVGGVDSVDWVLQLIAALRRNPVIARSLGQLVDEFYIDEVQDQKCIDIALLMMIVRDPRGFHFGGDTAQTISQDSTFRFQDVKALFHNRYDDIAQRLKQRPIAKPRMYSLNKNYRSHAGILAVASKVMQLLWHHFPDTIDRLDPEIGFMAGPLPVMFLGCDASILLSNDSARLEQGDMLFGAEQVVLTRDESSKTMLQDAIGDNALVLTIQQAKGMEFEDVLLWRFLSSSPDLPGWRSLQDSTANTSAAFDSQRYAAICLELKFLYVAITRARVHFAMIEPSSDAPQAFIRLMNGIPADPLVEVVTSNSSDVHERIKALTTRKSDDPKKWATIGDDMMVRQEYAEACLCYRRAKEPAKERSAKAHLNELRGREKAARQEWTEAVTLFNTALDAFTALEMTSAAARVLIHLQRYNEAAKIFYDQRDFVQAAGLFARAGDHHAAAKSWEDNQDFDRAILELHKGNLHDEVFDFLQRNQGLLSQQEFVRQRRFLKFLIRQQKISEHLRSAAIRLIGSPTEQETFLVEFNMHDELVKLYTAQRDLDKLFGLFTQLGRFKEAICCITPAVLTGACSIDEASIFTVVTHFWVDLIHSNAPSPSKKEPELQIMSSWRSLYDTLKLWKHEASQAYILGLSDPLIASFACLYVAIHVIEIVKVQTISEIPFSLLDRAIQMINSRHLTSSGPVGDAFLLLCGAYHDFRHGSGYVLRSWSPLHSEAAKDGESSRLATLAAQRVTAQVGKAILNVSAVGKSLWGIQWPRRCNFYLVTGRCDRQSTEEGCSDAHEHFTESKHANLVDNLMDFATLLCLLTPVYYRSLLPEAAQISFLGSRRYWLEKILVALTFISGFEQDASVIGNVSRKLYPLGAWKTVSSCLEDLLFHRLGREWDIRHDLGSILDQFNQATLLGPHVYSRFTRAVVYKSRLSRHATLYNVNALQYLESQIRTGDHSKLNTAIATHMQNLSTLEFEHFTSFHAHTAKVEYVATYLIYMICPEAMLVPKAWMELHLPAILACSPPKVETSKDAGHRMSLLLVLSKFIEILEWLSKGLAPGDKFNVGSSKYFPRLIHQRNAELIGLIIVNYEACGNTNAAPGVSSTSFRSHWQRAIRAFDLPNIRMRHLEHRVDDVHNLRWKLHESHKHYRGKNPLVIVTKRNAPQHAFSAFQRSFNIGTYAIDSIRAGTRYEVPQTATASSAPSTDLIDTDDAAILSAAKCIQRNWRELVPLVRMKNAYQKTEGGRSSSRIQRLTKASGIYLPPKVRSSGMKAMNLLTNHAPSVSQLEEPAYALVDKAELDTLEKVDDLIESVRLLREAVRRYQQYMKQEHLEALLRMGGVGGLQAVFEKSVIDITRDMTEVERLRQIIELS